MNHNYNAYWLTPEKNNSSALVEVLISELMILTYRNVGLTRGQVYFPWLVFLFLVMAILNLVGMLPFAFTVTNFLECDAIIFMGLPILPVVDGVGKFLTVKAFSNSNDFFNLISNFKVIVVAINYDYAFF